MGGALLRGRVDLMPFHRWVFSRLRATGCDRVYSFPRLHIIDLSVPLRRSIFTWDRAVSRS